MLGVQDVLRTVSTEEWGGGGEVIARAGLNHSLRARNLRKEDTEKLQFQDQEPPIE